MQVIHNWLHAFIELLQCVTHLLELPLKFKLDVILITEEREYAEDEGDQPKETSEGVKEPDKLLVGPVSGDEVEAKELEEEVGDGFLGHPLVRQYEYGMEEEVGGHKGNVGVAKDFLLLRFDLSVVHWVHCIEEKTQATAEGKSVDVMTVTTIETNLKVKGT